MDRWKHAYKFVEYTIKKCFDNNNDVILNMSQIRSKPFGTGLPSPVTPLFNRPIQALLPQMNSEPINIYIDNDHFQALKAHQDKYLKGYDTHKGSLTFTIDFTVVVQWEDGGPLMHEVIVESNSTDHNGWSYITSTTGRHIDHIQHKTHLKDTENGSACESRLGNGLHA